METQHSEQDICPVCDVGQLIEKTIDRVVTYEDQTTVVPDFKIHECITCGEAIADPKSVELLKPIMLALVEQASCTMEST